MTTKPKDDCRLAPLPAHAYDEWPDDETYRCVYCGEVVSFENGMADGCMSEGCDDCWSKAHPDGECADGGVA